MDELTREAQLLRIIQAADNLISYMQEMSMTDFPPAAAWRLEAQRILRDIGTVGVEFGRPELREVTC
jgi:hypothetical protein